MVDKPANLIIVDTKQDIINSLNRSGLPLTVKELMLSEILAMVKDQAEIYIQKEREAYFTKVQEEEKKAKSAELQGPAGPVAQVFEVDCED
jgi:hypothetical protein